MLSKLFKSTFVILILLIVLKLCCPKEESLSFKVLNRPISVPFINKNPLNNILIDKDVKVENYFQYLDSIICKYDSLTPYKLSEHLLVRANSWIIDTLQNTDYYRLKTKDSFVYDQKKMIVLNEGVSLKLPDSILANKILKSFKNTLIDINIPEYKLRIYEDTLQLFEFDVRVGRNEKKYLEMAGREEDLRTKIGNGKIVAHVKKPDYYNPVNGHKYHVTKRDDNIITALPQIPWLETEINGIRYGQLIHPTTNPKSLGKAYSNGCVGTKEADGWLIYYYAPIGTEINIRYDLNILTKKGEKVILKDIYNYY